MTNDPGFDAKFKTSMLVTLGKGALIVVNLVVGGLVAWGFNYARINNGDLADLRMSHDKTLTEIVEKLDALSGGVADLGSKVAMLGSRVDTLSASFDQRNREVDRQLDRADERLTRTEQKIGAIADRLVPPVTDPVQRR